VGGKTKVYGGALLRLRDRDFEQVKHYGGISPACPISYGDLEPYYAEAERLYLVHSQVGEDPTEGHFQTHRFPTSRASSDSTMIC
jgi:choline dehydrogenase-like flavoprotein